MPHRDFPIMPTRDDPPTFSVAGREFKALPEPPGGALSDFFWIFSERIEVKAAGLVRFIEACMPDEQAEAFRLAIHDKDTIVPLSQLADIAQWLVEVYNDRPTTPSSGLVAGSAPTPGTPEGGPDSPASDSTDSGSST